LPFQGDNGVLHPTQGAAPGLCDSAPAGRLCAICYIVPPKKELCPLICGA
jgi:hypothetical protein